MIDDMALVGGVLFSSPDPSTAALVLAAALKEGHSVSRTSLRKAGLDPDLVDALRPMLGAEATRIDRACSEGAAWARGRQSAQQTDPWELVATLPSRQVLPSGLRRTTGETLIHLVNAATGNLRIAAPYMDQSGLAHLSAGLAAATTRRVQLEILIPGRAKNAEAIFVGFLKTIEAEGDRAYVSLVRFRDDAPWAHLKVITADSVSAYVGSANLTSPGIAGRNLEMGVLVRGPRVATIERVLDLFKES